MTTAAALLFSFEDEPALLYGRLGYVLGHEWSHLVGPTNAGWERRFNQSQYIEKLSCIAQTYNCSVNTLSEDFADISGIQIAFQTFEKKLGKDGLKFRPFENCFFNNEQLFFISLAHYYCGEYPTDENGPHSHARLRILNTLRNSPAFANAFNCPLWSPMNAVDKCQIW